MRARILAVVAVAVALLGVAILAPLSRSAPPQPYNVFGLARQSDGVTPVGIGTRITTFIDGVDYSNGTATYRATGEFDVDTFGNWVTAIGQPNTPEVKEGGDVGDEIMYVAGDLTSSGQVFTAKKFWTPGDSVTDNLQLAPAANQPALLNVGRMTTRPADADTQYVYICNPTVSPVTAASYYLQKDTAGTYNGPMHILSGTVPPGGLLYVNLNAALTLVTTGDNLKLVYCVEYDRHTAILNSW